MNCGQLHFAFCNSYAHKEPVEYLALCNISLSNTGEPPEWIMLVPAGNKIDALDGRKFGNPTPQAVVDAFNADPRDVPIDWNHAEEIKAPKGEEAPAAGWVKQMEVREGAVWGQVEWTPRGIASLKSKEYRYLSPAFIFDKASKAVRKLLSAGLVNSPAFNMPALASHNGPAIRAMENTMEWLKLLGLTEDATPEQIKAAIEQLKQAPIDEVSAAKKELEETKTELANARKASPSLDHYVPRSEYDAAMARIKKLDGEKKASEEEARTKAVTAAIDKAMTEGKIVGASREKFLALCSTEQGFGQFKELVETLPPVCEPSRLETHPRPVPGGEGAVLTEEDRTIARQFGISEEEFLKEKADAIRVAQNS